MYAINKCTQMVTFLNIGEENAPFGVYINDFLVMTVMIPVEILVTVVKLCPVLS